MVIMMVNLRDIVESAVQNGIDRVKKIDKTDDIEIEVLTDVDATENRRRKVLEWTIDNVHHIKTVPSSKERAVRVTVTQAINEGWSKLELTNELETTFGIAEDIAQRITVTEVRRAYQWAFRQTAYEKGYRKMFFRIHPGACEICESLNGKMYKVTNDPIPIHPNCFDKYTEVYTSDGWKFFGDLNNWIPLKSEKILSLKPETLDLEWVDYIHYIKYHYKGEMYHWKSKIADLKVTPDHNMFVGLRGNPDDRTDWSYRIESAKETSEIKAGRAIYSSSKWEGEKREYFKIGDKKIPTELFMKFMGYWLSEGSCTRTKLSTGKRRDYISIAQKNTDEIYNDIEKMPYTLHKAKGYIGFKDKDMAEYLEQFGHSHQKFIPSEIKELDKKYLRIFLDAHLYGDGTTKKGKKWKGGNFSDSNSHFTTSSKLAGDIGELLIKCGNSVSYHLKKTKGKTVKFSTGVYTMNHNLWVINQLSHQHKMLNNDRLSIVDYDDFVYDVELEINHILLVRRNGKVCWSGNCRCWMELSNEDFESPFNVPAPPIR